MRKFTENLEQGYKNIEWELRLGGAIPAELLLDRDELDWTLQMTLSMKNYTRLLK